jgi:FkbM family methyltransferase
MTPLDPIVSVLAGVLAAAGSIFLPSSTAATQVTLSGAAVLNLPPGLPSARRLSAGYYEPELSTLIRSLLVPGSTLVDVGANVGYYTIIGSRLVGKAGRIYAFEPEAEVYRYLELNVRQNELGNVITVPKALADVSGARPFTSNALEGGFLSGAGESSPVVDAVSLDDFFAEEGWPRVDVVKIDVEGAEKLVLSGMRELSRRNAGLRLVMEYNAKAMARGGASPDGLREAMLMLGFRTAQVVEQELRAISLEAPLPRSGLIYNLLLSKG